MKTYPCKTSRTRWSYEKDCLAITSPSTNKTITIYSKNILGKDMYKFWEFSDKIRKNDGSKEFGTNMNGVTNFTSFELNDFLTLSKSRIK